MSYVRFGIKNIDGITKKLDGKKAGAEKALKATAKDAKKRVPGWIATEVTKVYGAKKGDITKQKLGSIKVVGSGLKDMKFIYAGRMLTPTHFSMTPKTPTAGSYSLKATIIKGQRKTLGKVKKLTKAQRSLLAKNFTKSGQRTSQRSPVMLMATGNTKMGGTSHIPFQRKSSDRKDIEAVMTISLPQMVSSDRTAPQIQQKINSGIQERLTHNMGRYMDV